MKIEIKLPFTSSINCFLEESKIGLKKRSERIDYRPWVYWALTLTVAITTVILIRYKISVKIAFYFFSLLEFQTALAKAFLKCFNRPQCMDRTCTSISLLGIWCNNAFCCQEGILKLEELLAMTNAVIHKAEIDLCIFIEIKILL